LSDYYTALAATLKDDVPYCADPEVRPYDEFSNAEVQEVLAFFGAVGATSRKGLPSVATMFDMNVLSKDAFVAKYSMTPIVVPRPTVVTNVDSAPADNSLYIEGLAELDAVGKDHVNTSVSNQSYGKNALGHPNTLSIEERKDKYKAYVALLHLKRRLKNDSKFIPIFTSAVKRGFDFFVNAVDEQVNLDDNFYDDEYEVLDSLGKEAERMEKLAEEYYEAHKHDVNPDDEDESSSSSEPSELDEFEAFYAQTDLGKMEYGSGFGDYGK